MTVPGPDDVAVEAGIVSPDADALARFYLDAFGFGVDDRFEFPQGVVYRLRNGGARLKIFQPADPVRSPGPTDPWHGEAGFAYAALHVVDARATFDHALRCGATGMVAPVSHRPGARYALLADPEGNVWELLEERR